MKINRPGYFWLDTWIMANVIQLATQEFCRKFLNLRNDPCGRQYDQMTQAARSVTANIAEGTSRHATSRETEMKLTDVARASLSELSNDYVNCFSNKTKFLGPYIRKSIRISRIFPSMSRNIKTTFFMRVVSISSRRNINSIRGSIPMIQS